MFRQVKPALWKAPLGALFCVGIFGARTLPFGVICAGMGPDAVAVLQAIIGVPLLFIRLEEWVTGLPLTIGDPACWRPFGVRLRGGFFFVAFALFFTRAAPLRMTRRADFCVIPISFVRLR